MTKRLKEDSGSGFSFTKDEQHPLIKLVSDFCSKSASPKLSLKRMTNNGNIWELVCEYPIKDKTLIRGNDKREDVKVTAYSTKEKLEAVIQKSDCCELVNITVTNIDSVPNQSIGAFQITLVTKTPRNYQLESIMKREVKQLAESTYQSVSRSSKRSKLIKEGKTLKANLQVNLPIDNIKDVMLDRLGYSDKGINIPTEAEHKAIEKHIVDRLPRFFRN